MLEIELKVFYCTRFGLEKYFDREMNTEIAWEMDLLGGYDHIFLPEASEIKSAHPLKINNASITVELSDFDPHVVLTYGYTQITQLRTLAWCRRRGVPIMLIGDSELVHERSPAVKLGKRAILPALLRQYACILTVGDHNEAYYRHYGVDDARLFRSPFTIDEPSYRLTPLDRANMRSAFRKMHGIEEQQLVVLAVGKLSERKRPKDLLEAAIALKSLPDGAERVHVVFAGNGIMLEELKKQAHAAAAQVTFLGFVNVDRLPEVYCGADILVHASEQDPHPLVLSEAACIGLPFVISDRVGAYGPNDIARQGRNAAIYPCGDVSALVNAILGLASRPDMRIQMGLESRRIFDELDVHKSVGGVLAAARHAVAERRGGNDPRASLSSDA